MGFRVECKFLELDVPKRPSITRSEEDGEIAKHEGRLQREGEILVKYQDKAGKKVRGEQRGKAESGRESNRERQRGEEKLEGKGKVILEEAERETETSRHGARETR